MGEWQHLTRRFVASLWPAGPRRDDGAWAEQHLLEPERSLWRRMSRPDRRHAVGVARDVVERLGDRATRPVVAAALLHDVGKVEAGLGTFGRVVATLARKTAGAEMAREWQRGRGFTRRVGLYLRHDTLGGDLLAMAGSDPLTEAWAREHHLPEDEWTLDPAVASVLKAVDDD